MMSLGEIEGVVMMSLGEIEGAVMMSLGEIEGAVMMPLLQGMIEKIMVMLFLLSRLDKVKESDMKVE